MSVHAVLATYYTYGRFFVSRLFILNFEHDHLIFRFKVSTANLAVASTMSVVNNVTTIWSYNLKVVITPK